MLRSLAPILALTLFATPVVAQEAVTSESRIEADGTTTLVHELTIAAPLADIWAAISTPEGWMEWAAPLARWVEGEPDVLETGYDPAEPPGGPGAIRQQFLVRIPGRLLAYRTVKTPEGFPHSEQYKQVTGVFELGAEGDRTRVRLTSTGFPNSEAGSELLAFFRRGNAFTLEQLRTAFSGK